MKSITPSLMKIANAINKKRQNEIFQIYSQTNDFDRYVGQAKEMGTFQKGNKSKSMRKLASFPVEVDAFFIKVYGPDYYKDKDFFKKLHPEWLVVKSLKL